ncbi:hypothetical protein GSI_12563 [Ganoderma sinense ZZ0214-1]|uniref:CID domain-containing protein n=1 Tax=Ganoderma sinense ZZ0214-1 TaxID=1077348 RepID=A0A2G8RT43_9APHY|nr:hypothetical protein GSI_12563 [Ganoderma sinense ZZ0214-1]
MATIEEFETALKEVVTAKRLSQSKMASLTEIAMRCMENDTQMVSILYRTHKGLTTGGKTWSLYAFDALARAARHQVNKNQINQNQGHGNCVTFLRKIEGVLDGLFEDIATAGTNDLKEKAKKILDIWAKSNTFPSAVLSPLYALLKQAENDKEPDMPPDQSANPTPNPHSMPALPPTQPPNPQPSVTPFAGADIQSALFALLSKAANVAGTNGVAPGQTPPNIGPASAPSAPAAPPTPVLDANQLALLHQLAQTAKGIAPASAQTQPLGVVQQQPVPSSLVPSNIAVPVVPPSALANVGGTSTSQPQVYRDDQYGPPTTHARESEPPHHQPYGHGGRYTPDAAAAAQSHDPRAGGYLRGSDYGTPSHDRDAAVTANLTPKPTGSYEYDEHGRNRPIPDPDASYGPGLHDHDRDRDHSPRDPRRDGPPRGFRGSPGRGRGRGRWDDRRGPGDYHPQDSRGRDRDHRDDYRDRDRDYDDRDRDRDRDRGQRRRRDSRSWSPQGRRRGRPPRSPTRRRGPRGDRDRRGDGEGGFRERYTYVPGRDGAEPGFDEFGRELRPSTPEREHEREPECGPALATLVQSPMPNASSIQSSHPGQRQGRTESPFPPGTSTASVTASDGGSVAPEDALSVREPGQGLGFGNYNHQPAGGHPPPPYGAPPSEPSTSTMASLSPAPSASSATLPPASSSTSTSAADSGGEGGLDTFDRAAFDPSQPASWEALGRAWATTHGRAPSQEELMQFVFGAPCRRLRPPRDWGSTTTGLGAMGVGAGAGTEDEVGATTRAAMDTMSVEGVGAEGGGTDLGEGEAAEGSMGRGAGATSRGTAEEITDRRGREEGAGAGSSMAAARRGTNMVEAELHRDTRMSMTVQVMGDLGEKGMEAGDGAGLEAAEHMGEEGGEMGEGDTDMGPEWLRGADVPAVWVRGH